MPCNNCRIGISRPAKITKTICQRAGITKKVLKQNTKYLSHANLPRFYSTRGHTNICTSEYTTTATHALSVKYSWPMIVVAYCLRFLSITKQLKKLIQ